MKLSFSTLGCPLWPWEDILATAKDFGYDGIEVRGVGSEIYVPRAKPFRPENISATKGNLAKLGLEIGCLTSGALLHKSDKDYVKEAFEYINTAEVLGVKYVRVLGDTGPEPSEVDFKALRQSLAVVSEYAAGKGVEALLETNGVFAESARAAELVSSIGGGLGILWDVHHPYRFFGEPPEATYANIKDYLRFVHVKDSVVEGGRVKYRLLGEGDVPVEAAVELLVKNGYGGYVSLEWVKRWNTELEEPGIVFMHFINTIGRMRGN